MYEQEDICENLCFFYGGIILATSLFRKFINKNDVCRRGLFNPNMGSVKQKTCISASNQISLRLRGTFGMTLAVRLQNYKKFHIDLITGPLSAVLARGRRADRGPVTGQYIIYYKISPPKTENFQIKNSNIFHTSDQKHRL